MSDDSSGSEWGGGGTQDSPAESSDDELFQDNTVEASPPSPSPSPSPPPPKRAKTTARASGYKSAKQLRDTRTQGKAPSSDSGKGGGTFGSMKVLNQAPDAGDDDDTEYIVSRLVEAEQPPELLSTLLPFQRESLTWMKQQEASMFRGGLLADEMGMGKTVQAIALIVANRRDVLQPLRMTDSAAYVSTGVEKQELKAQQAAEKAAKKAAKAKAKASKKGASEAAVRAADAAQAEAEAAAVPDIMPASTDCSAKCTHPGEPEVFSDVRFARAHLWCGVDPALDRSTAVAGFTPPAGPPSRTTLVVCPVVAVAQWASEFEKHVKPGVLKVCQYVGTVKQRADMAPRLTEYDVVLTSYSVVEAEFRKMVATTKVKCKYCGKTFFPEKLEIHWRYFCGPDAKRTAAQSLTERHDEAGDEAEDQPRVVKKSVLRAGKSATSKKQPANSQKRPRGRPRKSPKPAVPTSSSTDSDAEVETASAAMTRAMRAAVAKAGKTAGRGIKRTRSGAGVGDDEGDSSGSDAESETGPGHARGSGSLAVVGVEGRQRGQPRLGPMSALQAISWRRVILDEGHYIKNRRSGTAKAVFNLTAERRWCLSGTPLQNRVGELFSQIRFLRTFPFAYYFSISNGCKSLDYCFGSDFKHCEKCGETPLRHYCYWNRRVQNPILRWGYSGPGADSMALLRGTILKGLLLRRTKQGRAADLALPPRLITITCQPLDAFENDFYEALYTSSRSKFDTYVGKGTVLHNYASIFDLLMRLRQAVDHPYLVLYSASAMAAKAAQAALHSSDQAGGAAELAALPPTAAGDVCTLCGEGAEDAVASGCGHVFCADCARSLLAVPEGAASPTCPACFAELSLDLSAVGGVAGATASPTRSAASTPPGSESDDDSPKAPITPRTPLTRASRATILSRIPPERIGRGFRSSTKIEALLQSISEAQTTDPGSKCIVFSQYVSFLDLIQHRLAMAGVRSLRLDGRLSAKARGRVIAAFAADPTITAFCISLKAGGVALNLTCANRIYLMDPWWNPAAELQAMDRTHRVGQHRAIQVVRFIVPGTVEERIIALQEKKRLVLQATVGGDSSSLSRLTEQDLRYLFSR